jgi:hypothetical protein
VILNENGYLCVPGSSLKMVLFLCMSSSANQILVDSKRSVLSSTMKYDTNRRQIQEVGALCENVYSSHP